MSGQEGEQYQEVVSGTTGRAYVSAPCSPELDGYTSQDPETTALILAIKNGDFVPITEGSHHAYQTSEVTNELERSALDNDVKDEFQLFEHHDAVTSCGQAGLDSLGKDPRTLAGLQDNSEQTNSYHIASAPVSGRRKFVIPKLPDFNRLLERYQ